MSKFTKRMAAFVLAATMLVSTGSSAFAATSPTEGTEASATTTKTKKAKKSDEIQVTKATSKTKNLYIQAKINKKYVRYINSGAVKGKKYSKITFELYRRTYVRANVLKGKSLKSKKVIITKRWSANKLKASKFNKKAFANYKGKIVVKKSAMSKKEFKKLKKRLKKGGFKGKIYYKK